MATGCEHIQPGNSKLRSNTKIPKVCLVAPLPPPNGGIGQWTRLITQYFRDKTKADLSLVDISPRWRKFQDLRPWRRWAIGSVYGLALLGKVIWHLAKGNRVLHITTSGQLAIHRDIAMMRVAKAFGVPIFYHLHFGRIPELARSGNKEWQLLVKALHLATTVIPIDQQTQASLKAHLPSLSTCLLPNCVDHTSLPTTPRPLGSSRTLLYLGWVIPTKGIEELLGVWADLSVPNWRLVIAGPFEILYRKSLAKRFPLQGVEFTGELNHQESMELMASADVFVLPSHTEGFPFVIAEAMALARPILATSVGAIPEMLRGECGLVIPPGDFGSLKASLEILMTDERLRNRLGQAALEKSLTCYSLDIVFGKLMALWQQSIEVAI